jgi:hypothetical protein
MSIEFTLTSVLALEIVVKRTPSKDLHPSKANAHPISLNQKYSMLGSSGK